jgi:hypothetical protein
VLFLKDIHGLSLLVVQPNGEASADITRPVNAADSHVVQNIRISRGA